MAGALGDWRPVSNAMLRGAVYFVIVFSVGFVFGTIRVLWLEPRIGTRLAELSEAPLMLVAIFSSARLVVQWIPAGSRMEYLVSGGLALLLLVVVEFWVVLGMRDLSVGEYLAARDPIAGSVYALMLVIFAVMPFLLGRKRGEVE